MPKTVDKFSRRVEALLDDRDRMIHLSQNTEFQWYMGQIAKLQQEYDDDTFESGKRPCDYSHVELVETLAIRTVLKRILNLPKEIRFKAKAAERREDDA